MPRPMRPNPRPDRRWPRAWRRGVTTAAATAVGAVGAVGLGVGPAVVTAGVAHAAPVPATAGVPAAVAATAQAALDALARGDGLGFARTRLEVAAAVATATGTDPRAVAAAWERAGERRTAVVLTALTELGTPYRRNTSEPGVGFDCSGLTSYAWRQAGAVELPRNSERQARAGAVVAVDDALAGDLVHYPGHVSLYLGVPGAALHAPSTGRTVEFNRSTARWVRYIAPVGAEDPLPAPPVFEL